MPGKGKMTVTGNLRDVMKESISAAASYVRSRAVGFGIEPPMFDRRDIHVHVPEGATPKDGPSAGVAMATAIVSIMTGIPVRHDVAMTGEITLRGRVLPIGGLKEKLLAAARGGIKTVLIPEDNAKDLTEISDAIKGGMTIIPVARLDDVDRPGPGTAAGGDHLGRGHQGAGQAGRHGRSARRPDGALSLIARQDNSGVPTGRRFCLGESEHQSSSWPGSSRPSTSFLRRYRKDVDARDKPGHDAEGPTIQAISADLSPPASLAFTGRGAVNSRRGRLAQLVRASRLHREGRRFESVAAYQPSPCGLRLGKPDVARRRLSRRSSKSEGGPITKVPHMNIRQPTIKTPTSLPTGTDPPASAGPSGRRRRTSCSGRSPTF